MAIYKLIANGSFGPDEIKVMSEAYEGSLIDLGILNRDDPITELIAKSIVNVTATGERDPKQVMERPAKQTQGSYHAQNAFEADLSLGLSLAFLSFPLIIECSHRIRL